MSDTADTLRELERIKSQARADYPDLIATLREKYRADEPGRVWTRDDLYAILADLRDAGVGGKNELLAVAAAVREMR